MNTTRIVNGMTIHKYTKPRYNLMAMYEQALAKHGYCAIDSEPADPAYAALHKWYHGESGEQCCVTKLKRLGLIGEDTFTEVEVQPAKLQQAINRRYIGWQKR